MRKIADTVREKIKQAFGDPTDSQSEKEAPTSSEPKAVYTPQATTSTESRSNSNSSIYNDESRYVPQPKIKPPRRIPESHLAINQETEDGKSYSTKWRNEQKGI